MIQLLPAGNPGPYTGPTGNNTWLVDGRRPLLVDAGVGDEAHLAALAQALGNRTLATILVTHGHRDHAAGLPRLRAAYPRARIIGGDGEPAHEGARVDAGDRAAEVIATPGHSSDHACLWLPAERVLFAGDLVVRGSSVMISPSSGGNLRQYLASLQRVRDLRPARIYPGHGPVIDDPDALIELYLAHRRDREQQILAALDNGPADLDALARAIYPDLNPALTPAARETLLAHLAKLDEEKRVSRTGGAWQLR